METVALLDKTGERVDPSSLQTSRDTWVAIATSASAGAEPVDIDETERTYQTAKVVQAADAAGAKIAFFDVPRSWNGIRVRASGITADQSYVAKMYLGTLGDGKKDSDNSAGDKTFNCELGYFGQFTWTIGAQVSADTGYEMADTLVLDQTGSSYPSIDSADIQSPTGDRVAETRFDLNGADLIMIVPTTVGADSIFKAKGY